jgi:hypothetical protein
MKTVLRIVLGLAVLIFLVHYFGQTSSPPSDVRNGILSGQPAEVVRLTSQGLFFQYENNEVATDLALKGKIVEVAGPIQSINKDAFDHIYVSLVTTNQFEPAQMHVLSSEEAKIAALRRGQYAVFRCPTMKRWVGSPSGDDCVLISAQ